MAPRTHYHSSHAQAVCKNAKAWLGCKANYIYHVSVLPPLAIGGKHSRILNVVSFHAIATQEVQPYSMTACSNAILSDKQPGIL